jgi:murein DD-endopeptidase MepM/ murein hydrolase activator NlpD
MSFEKIDISKEVEVPLPPHVGAFGVARQHHIHEGIDLYAPVGTPVFAIESGKVVGIEWFTGPEAGFPWWRTTQVVLIESKDHVIAYGEIEPLEGIAVGDEINEGDQVGSVLRVLRKDKGRPTSMLHIELYEPGMKMTHPWPIEGPRPPGLRDPTTLLLKAAHRFHYGDIYAIQDK